MRIYKGDPSGIYLTASSICGEDSAIRIRFVDDDETRSYEFSPTESLKFADELKDLVNIYLGYNVENLGVVPKCIFDNEKEEI